MKSAKVFISYSHKDEKIKDALVVHLASLKHSGIIEEWHDRKILPGDEFGSQIDSNIENSDIILLLISGDFISSKYCHDIEMKKAMEKHENKEAVVIPVILRNCLWTNNHLFSKLLALPTDGKAVENWVPRNKAYFNIISGIQVRVNEILEKVSKKEEENKAESDGELVFSQDMVIARLPRGYVLIKDIEFSTYSSWAVTAHYYDYAGKWKASTHYHESYRARWESAEGGDSQLHKLHIQKADWRYAYYTLDVVMDIRQREVDDVIVDILDRYRSEEGYFDYYRKGDVFPKIIAPENYFSLIVTGSIRDIIEGLSIEPWEENDLKELHAKFNSLRRKSYLILHDNLGKSHPALSYIKEISDEYKSSFNVDQLKEWGAELRIALIDICHYMR